MKSILFIFSFFVLSFCNAQQSNLYLDSNNFPKKVAKKIDLSTIIKAELLDSNVVFKENQSDFQRAILNHFDMEVFGDSKGEFWAKIYILIDENGKISQQVADGNHTGFVREAEFIVSKIKNNFTFKPAVYKGNPVKTIATIPLAMKIE